MQGAMYFATHANTIIHTLQSTCNSLSVCAPLPPGRPHHLSPLWHHHRHAGAQQQRQQRASRRLLQDAAPQQCLVARGSGGLLPILSNRTWGNVTVTASSRTQLAVTLGFSDKYTFQVGDPKP